MSGLEDLETLNSLREKGIISEEEFQSKKAAILNSKVQGGKSQLVYVLLAFFLGVFGIHNFYAGRWKKGLVQLLLTILTFGIGTFITGPWSIINIFTTHTDGKGGEMEPCAIAKYIFGILGLFYYLITLGVMGMGGIFGYTSAMNKYKANEILNYTSMVQTIALAKDGGNGISYAINCEELLPSTSPSYFRTCSVAPGGQVTLSGLDNLVENTILKINPAIHRDNDGQLIIPSAF